MGAQALSDAPSAQSRKLATVREVLDALRRIVQDLRLSSRTVEKRAGLSAAQVFVLHVLAADPGLSLAGVAERTRTDASSVSVVIQRLVGTKLVSRLSSSADARRVELSVTAKGHRLVRKYPEPMQFELFAAIECLSAKELAGLASGLNALVREMHIEEAATTMFFETVRSGKRRPKAAVRRAPHE